MDLIKAEDITDSILVGRVTAANLDVANEAGARQVAKDIQAGKPTVPAAAAEKTDRTVVTADTDRQKVDVYKINLRRSHKIKAGIMTADGKTYGGIGYQAGKWEGMIYTRSGRKVDAAAITYTLAEW